MSTAGIKENLIPDINRRKLSRDVLNYSLIFIVTALACYIFFVSEGKTLIKYCGSNADGLTQTYTAYVALKHMLQNALAGNGWDAWNWSLGLGGDNFEYFGFKLFNPLTYLIVAFPDNLIDVGYSIANVLREYLAGFTFLLCMREVRLPSRACVYGAVSYAFCGWLVEVLLNQGSFENIAIIFPLLVMGTEKIYKKQSPVLFIVSVALCMATGVVWAYIAGFLTVIYYCARYHEYHSGEGLVEFAKNAGEYILYGIIGILIASPFVLSILCSMGGATTDTGADYRVWTFSLAKYLKLSSGLYTYAEVGATSYSYICVSAICICLLPLVITQLKKKSTAAWLTVGLFVLSLIPLTSKFFNGMSYPAGRWYFGLMFFAIWATMECFNEETLSERRNYAIMGIWINVVLAWNVAMYLLGIEERGSLLMVIAGTCCCLAFLALAYMRYVKGAKDSSLALLMTLVLMASVIYPVAGKTCPALTSYLDKYMSVGQSADKLRSTPERVVPELEDGSFFRVDQAYRVNKKMRTKLKTNSNIVYGNKSIYTYSSLLDSGWNLFNKAVGNNAGYYSRTNIYSNDNRAALDYLFGVKYFLGDNKYEKNASDYAGYGYKEYKTVDGVDVLKTDHCIGLGTAFDKYITESELMEYPQLVRDQVLLQAVVVPDERAEEMTGIRHATAGDISTVAETVDITVTTRERITIDEKNKRITVSKGKGKFEIDCPEQQDVQLILSLEGLRRETTGREKGTFKVVTKFKGTKKYAYCEQDSPRGFNDIENYNIHLGYGETIGGKIQVILTAAGDYSYDAIKVYAIPSDIIDANAEKLENSSLKIDSYSGDIVTGTVNTGAESLLFLSMPYDRGWRAYVDGEEVETIKNVNIGFTGIRVPAGEHQLELKYSHWGMKAALMGTVIGIAGLLSIIIRRRKNGSK